VDIEALILNFQDKLVLPLIADITRTLEVTCHKSGKQNHGSNFVGNAVVLMGIEAAAQFICQYNSLDDSSFREMAKTQFSNLDTEQKSYLSPKHSKCEGSQLAKQFMKEYFGAWFNNRKEFGVPLNELVWAFRNPHAHAFYPYFRRMFNQAEVSGAVDWLYKDGNQSGITITEIEENFETLKDKLYIVDGQCFRMCPQILFVFFKQALGRFVERIRTNQDCRTSFSNSYHRLGGIYGFEPTQA
jgi:hypothetical protein